MSSGNLLSDIDNVRVPDRSARIWRYLDLSRFLSMLQSQSIYFATEYELLKSDKWEGAFGSWAVLSKLKYNRQMDIEEAYFDGNATQTAILRKLADNDEDDLLRLAVSCWHCGESESAAMWKLYTRGQDGVAIRTSVSRLLSALRKDHREPEYGFVNYLTDGESERCLNSMRPVQSVFTKRAVYEYEKEVRFIVRSDGISGFPVHVDLQSIVEDIVLSPDYPDWAQRGLKDALDRFGLSELTRMVRRSSVGDPPASAAVRAA